MSKFLVVGLGNWPEAYHKNRHNLGFLYLDNLLGEKFTVNGKKGKKLVLYKPQTMMNLSGKGIKRKLEFLNIPIENLIVVYDDASMEFGKVRYRETGSSGGHNGIKSIIASLGTMDFKRIKVGVGEPSGSLIDHVLEDFSQEELDTLPFDEITDKINEIIKTD